MTRQILSLSLLLSLCLGTLAVEEETLEVISVVSANCTLQCTARYTPGVQYLAVRWYKVSDAPDPGLSGLLSRKLPNGPTQLYTGVQWEVDLQGGTRDIFLPNVTCSDRGTYACHLAAPVGQQNREGQVTLTLTDCLTEMTDAYLVILASVVLLLALLIFLISYKSLTKTLGDRNKTLQKEAFLDPNKPLDEKDLKSIKILGPKVSKEKQFWV
ncbi:CD83 antigen-like [Trematomus bernacchii]|uniref:CD83 antigen-like n=1 Tax=Trematomus bernacchii TaxID=40690 RepID=UPI00146AA8DC|nr:CD83 antigen-like [Trematomus bernacchii]